MKRTIGTCLAVISAATMSVAPAIADKPDKPAKPDKPSNAKAVAAQQCNGLKKADKAAFKSLYGPKQAMRNCKKSQTNASEGEFKNAAKECKAEQAADPALFEETYGDDDPYTAETANAYGKCVSSKVKEEDTEDTEEFDNAAKQCKAERAEDKDAFNAKYGTEKSKYKNALGKCVSQTVKAGNTTA